MSKPKNLNASMLEEPKSIFSMVKRVAMGMLVTVLLMAGSKYVEHTPFGHKVETITFEYLQRLLPSYSEEMPIIVLDISRIPGGKDQPTSREALRQTLTALVAQRPSAVGIDVDFSPGLNGWQDDDDPEFFDFCLKLERDSQVPIFLGVYRTIGEKSDTWLGSAKYKELAAALRAEDDTKRLPRWLQAKDSNERLPMLSAALAESYHPASSDAARRLSRTVEVFTQNTEGIELKGEDEMLFGLALVNFSRLEQIQRETLLMLKPESIAESGQHFAGKIVILGDATESQDYFNVPGREAPISGVYLIACAAYTLAVEPLYELNTGARLALDLVISVLIILRVEWLRSHFVRKRPGPVFHRKQSRSIWLALVIVTFIGLLMTWGLNIMWFDFPLVGFALLLHPKVEHNLNSFWRKLRAKPQTSAK
jgi:CHASE2 domain-containing sensor protein